MYDLLHAANLRRLLSARHLLSRSISPLHQDTHAWAKQTHLGDQIAERRVDLLLQQLSLATLARKLPANALLASTTSENLVALSPRKRIRIYPRLSGDQAAASNEVTDSWRTSKMSRTMVRGLTASSTLDV
uniref:Uncharacterized protein n=1 Tax=Moniliophthora roreri TaxID=221103 RepID=A0A0W0FZX9_MONRR